MLDGRPFSRVVIMAGEMVGSAVFEILIIIDLAIRDTCASVRVYGRRKHEFYRFGVKVRVWGLRSRT